MGFEGAAGDGEAKARSTGAAVAGGVATVERREDLFEVFGRDAWAGVGDGERDPA